MKIILIFAGLSLRGQVTMNDDDEKSMSGLLEDDE